MAKGEIGTQRGRVWRFKTLKHSSMIASGGIPKRNLCGLTNDQSRHQNKV